MPKIIVIEDDEDVLENIQEILEMNDYEVLTAKNGQIGLDLILKEIPDLIISDINMPVMNGYELLSILRNDVNTYSIPFLFLSAKVEKNELRFGMDLGADDYITKPFKIAEVLGAVSTRLERNSSFKAIYDTKLNDLRRNIATSLPHELRTPLNSIIGFSQFIVGSFDDLSKDDIIGMLKNIYQSGKRLLDLVTNYNYYTNLLANSHSENYDEHTISQLDNVHEIGQTIFEKYTKNVKIKYDINSAIIKISDTHFRKIIEEIIDNAIKFASEGSDICISGEIIGDKYFVNISNYGILLNYSDVNNIEAFMQFNRGKFEQQGTGLGLVIVKKILELYKGVFSADNFDHNGARITVGIPLIIE